MDRTIDDKALGQDVRLMELGILNWPLATVYPSMDKLYEFWWPPSGLAAKHPCTSLGYGKLARFIR